MYREHQLQAECVRWFRLAFRPLSLLLFAVPNGGRRSRWEAGQLKAEGMVAGVADLVLLVPNATHHALCIEMKQEQEEWRGGRKTTTRTYQRESQREWQAAVEGMGYRYEVVRSFDSFQVLINDYLQNANYKHGEGCN